MGAIKDECCHSDTSNGTKESLKWYEKENHSLFKRFHQPRMLPAVFIHHHNPSLL